MSAITATSIELAGKLAMGEFCIQAYNARSTREKEASQTHTHRNVTSYLLPTALSTALYWSVRIPVSTTSRLSQRFSHIAGPFAYTSVKDIALENNHIPDPFREIIDGTLGGGAAGAVDCLLRRIKPFSPIPGLVSSARPKFLPYIAGGGVAGAGFVLGSVLADQWMRKD